VVGEPFFRVAFPVGFGGLMALAVGPARWYESRAEPADETDEATSEERVATLLRTEDVATAREAGSRRAREPETGAAPGESETERD
jgi:hypothetical protein